MHLIFRTLLLTGIEGLAGLSGALTIVLDASDGALAARNEGGATR